MFYNLGNFLDVTTTPHKADFIVCLGGGEKEGRIDKAYELYTNGFSDSNLLLLTGDDRNKKRRDLGMDDKRIEFLKSYSFNEKHLIHFSMIGNTKVEILLIKEYMLKKNFKDVLIVTDAPHSRRVQTLWSLIKVDGDEVLRHSVIASKVDWWDADNYFATKKAKAFATVEFIKLVYIYVAFGFLDKVGLYEPVREMMMPSYSYLKKKIISAHHLYLKSTS